MESLFPQAYGFFLLLLRTAGLTVALPGLGMKTVPARVRIAVAAAVTAPIFIGAGSPHPPLPSSMLTLLTAGFTETLEGLAIGLACELMLSAATSAGHLLGMSMGLNYGAVVHPTLDDQAVSSAAADIIRQLALGAVIAAGLHREAFAWLCHEAVRVPPGSLVDVRSFMQATVSEGLQAITVGYRLAFPFIAIVNVGHLALGLISRAAPQVSLHHVGFSITILLGGFALYIGAPVAADRAAYATLAIFGRG